MRLPIHECRQLSVYDDPADAATGREPSDDELYTALIEDIQDEQRQAEYDQTVINLLDLASICRRYGMPEALRAAADTDGQLSAYLDMDLDGFSSDEERGTAVADRIREQLHQQRPSDGTEGSTEFWSLLAKGALEVAMAVFGDTLARLILKWLDKGTKLHEKMEEVREAKLSNEDRVDTGKFAAIDVDLPPEQLLRERMEALDQLGDYMVDLLESEGDGLDRNDIIEYLEASGFTVSVSDDDVEIRKKDIEERDTTLGEYGWGFGEFVTWYDSVTEAVAEANRDLADLKQFAEEKQEKKDELEEKAAKAEKEQENELDEDELKERKKQAKINKKLIKEASRIYFDETLEEGRRFFRIAKKVELKKEEED